MAVKWMIFIALLLIVKAGAQLLEFGFNQVDFSGDEGILTVTVTISGDNNGNFSINVTPLTFTQFENNAGILPEELEAIDLPDPAELTPAPGDFDDSVQTVTFPPSDGSVDMTLDILLTDDNIHEAQEGFFLVATVAAGTDATNTRPIRNGVALIRIFNDDMLTLSFSNTAYILEEDNSIITNLVFVSKDIPSEVDLPLNVVANPDATTRGIDFAFPTDFQLLFAPTDTQLSVDFEIFEDNLVESDESFTFVLSLPLNPPPGYSAGSSAIVTIQDDEFAVIGFEQEEYTASEGDLFVEVCVVLILPSDISLLSTFVFIAASSTGDTAEGNGIDYEDYSINQQFAFARQCENISLIDDSLVENTERFNLSGMLTVPPANITFDPSESFVFILDNDGATTTPPPPTVVVETDIPTAATTDTDTDQGTVTMGGDPHFSILLPTGQPLCFSIQGEHGFTFNLVANDLLQLNALFIPDGIRSEVTWIGELGIIVKGAKYKMLNDTKLRFVAEEKMIYMDNRATLAAKGIERIHLSKGKLTLVEGKRDRGQVVVDVILEDVGLEFSVRFVKGTHLDMVWKKVLQQQPHSHGLIGQFFRSGVKVDEARRLLLLPNMEPVPVMRKPVWHFMERETPDKQLCWVAMNPGYQGKHLIEGHYFDYLVDSVLSSNFECKEEN